ncbi:MAG TPA: hypothetical protein VGK32_16060 [Vicinamibacterales bacterium]|jgi:hypothetical protein
MTVRNLSASAALDELQRTRILGNALVEGSLSLRPLCEADALQGPVRIVGCVVDQLDGACIEFAGPVLLEGNHIRRVEFFATYFLAGLTMRGCVFEDTVDFQCGGHNRNGSAIILEGCTFRGFVNFYDCWFEGPFAARRCDFQAGTNLRGNRGKPFQVQFDVTPEVAEVTGTIDANGEGTA